ncbi:MAG: hypothetical protein JWQ38_2386 [Flavipsychrobacter sp.]|nr:hypothetical protein [Flavipsychrobacter sp.]
MKEYIVIFNSLLSDLEKEVSERLNEGWVLVGGISMSYKHEHVEHAHGHMVYAQAMQK